MNCNKFLVGGASQIYIPFNYQQSPLQKFSEITKIFTDFLSVIIWLILERNSSFIKHDNSFHFRLKSVSQNIIFTS